MSEYGVIMYKNDEIAHKNHFNLGRLEFFIRFEKDSNYTSVSIFEGSKKVKTVTYEEIKAKKGKILYKFGNHEISFKIIGICQVQCEFCVGSNSYKALFGHRVDQHHEGWVNNES